MEPGEYLAHIYTTRGHLGPQYTTPPDIRGPTYEGETTPQNALRVGYSGGGTMHETVLKSNNSVVKKKCQ